MLHKTSPVFIQRTASLVNRFPAFRTFAAFLQEWVPGGELFHHLDIEGSFSDAAACFYAANVLLALECLHARGIVYRDLKPENLLLDTKVRITLRRAGGLRLGLILARACLLLRRQCAAGVGACGIVCRHLLLDTNVRFTWEKG